ncbi:Uncharacterized conserved protein, DUF1330 family [Chitinophaga sp. CF118]|uniref:DUF1330 domain-containing protein n=1 Tax=Chitinophaga sp. CF118 TaxID=1884367 RepID=UPI0008F0A958|nr:DUF1330 domain-containing protein [Chitinophaga sp. CF118]SFF02110.1 Uncharacterized conserved protein, DUF1330 family [Chitinophaga sp. CF118]
MDTYYIISYDINDMEDFQQYPPLALPLINKYKGEVIISDLKAIAVEGTAKKMNALVKFPSIELALACYNDEEYKEIAKIRFRSTSNCSMILAEALV